MIEELSVTVALADKVIPVAELTEVMVVPAGMPVPEIDMPATSPAVEVNVNVLTAVVEPTVDKVLTVGVELSDIEKAPEVPVVFDLSDSTNWFVPL